MNVERVAALSETIREAGLAVKVLSRISWPESTIEEFLEGHRRGNPVLPQVTYERDPALLETAARLDGVAAELADSDDVIDRFLRRTALSYAEAARLVDAAGTPAFLDRTIALYGQPSSTLPGASVSFRRAAEHLLDVTLPLLPAAADEAKRMCLLPDAVADSIRDEVDEFFGAGEVQVIVDPALSAKAAASVNRIRIRGGTCFAESDVEQLLHHEAFVHTATAKNGENQPLVKAMRLGAPRTTATQEGLATLAELVTGSMDLTRLRRLALRIVAVDLALHGADFLEVFRFFLDAGQSEDESARSAARVFRGGDVRGGVAFTKDAVYLHGLVAAHTFLLRAIIDGRVELIPRLFAGRLTLQDVLELEPAFEDGRIAPGRYLPPWAADPRRLAASLSFSILVNAIDVTSVELTDIRA